MVEDRQLSLAIGKKGQNVRLAAKLTGWKTISRARKKSAARWKPSFEDLGMTDKTLTLTLPGLDDDQLGKLSDAGLDTAERLLEVGTAEFARSLGSIKTPLRSYRQRYVSRWKLLSERLLRRALQKRATPRQPKNQRPKAK